MGMNIIIQLLLWLPIPTTNTPAAAVGAAVGATTTAGIRLLRSHMTATMTAATTIVLSRSFCERPRQAAAKPAVIETGAATDANEAAIVDPSDTQPIL